MSERDRNSKLFEVVKTEEMQTISIYSFFFLRDWNFISRNSRLYLASLVDSWGRSLNDWFDQICWIWLWVRCDGWLVGGEEWSEQVEQMRRRWGVKCCAAHHSSTFLTHRFSSSLLSVELGVDSDCGEKENIRPPVLKWVMCFFVCYIKLIDEFTSYLLFVRCSLSRGCGKTMQKSEIFCHPRGMLTLLSVSNFKLKIEWW